MPPTDTNSTPFPEPAPQSEPPKKQSFWAKLFGKKEAAPTSEPPRSTLTPEPQLENTPAPTEASVAPLSDASGEATSPEVAAPAAVQSSAEEPAPALSAEPQSPLQPKAPEQAPSQTPPQPPVPPQQ